MSLSTVMQKGKANGCLTWQPNWSVLKLISSSPLGPGATLAAKKASGTIPIVIASAADPVGSGLVSSLAQPGGNITGLSLMAPDLDGKRLELLKEAVPKVARVAFLWQPGSTRGNQALTEMEAAAKALGLKLLSLEVRSLDDFEGAFARAKKERAQALITTTGGRINTQQRRVLDFAAKNRLPAIYHYSEFVEAGGLMSYGPDNTDLWRRAADLCRQDIERRQTGRFAGGAGDEVRVHHQSESGKADRSDDSAECAGAGGQSDQIDQAATPGLN